jgi:hypothetical protein
MGLWLTRDNEMAVILSEAKDLQFRSSANQCRFFASLRMTLFRESTERNTPARSR